jgi:hypothetical protein
MFYVVLNREILPEGYATPGEAAEAAKKLAEEFEAKREGEKASYSILGAPTAPGRPD